MKLKVCGNILPEQVKAFDDLGVDMAGFNFYPSSPRYMRQKISPEKMKQLKDHMVLASESEGTTQFNESEEPTSERLLDMGANAVLIKGGHLPGDRVSDLLVRVNQDPVWWHGDRIETANTHGTGCTLSSAIATFMAQGVDLVTAVGNARDVIRQALRAGAGVTTGRGSGPLNHFAAPVAMQINTINK